jgi:hypothetical protein
MVAHPADGGGAGAREPRVLLVFVDGLGTGRLDPSVNPCTDPGLGFFDNFTDAIRTRERPFGALFAPLAADLGVPGLPQSATGQTALFAGVNAAALLGAHLFGFPSPRLCTVLAERSLLRIVRERGYSVTFANAYRPEFFAVPYESLAGRVSVTTVATRAAGVPFRTFADLERGLAVCHDITHWTLIARGHPLAPVSPEAAGAHLARVVEDHHLTVFEYFLTDRAGHRRDRRAARVVLADLERFLAAALARLDLTVTTVLLTSDHGNLEDLSTRAHTGNPVQTLVWGRAAPQVHARLHSLVDVYPALLALFPDRSV